MIVLSHFAATSKGFMSLFNGKLTCGAPPGGETVALSTDPLLLHRRRRPVAAGWSDYSQASLGEGCHNNYATAKTQSLVFVFHTRKLIEDKKR